MNTSWRHQSYVVCTNFSLKPIFSSLYTKIYYNLPDVSFDSALIVLSQTILAVFDVIFLASLSTKNNETNMAAKKTQVKSFFKYSIVNFRVDQPPKDMNIIRVSEIYIRC